MNQKFVRLLEELDEGVAENHQKKICIDTVKNPNKSFLGGPSAKEAEETLKTKFGYTDKQIAKLKESIELEEGRKPISDEEKETRQIAKDEAPKKKRGRPAKEEYDDEDDNGEEGVRDVTLTATIKIDGKKEKDEKILKDFKVVNIDKAIKDWEKELHKKFDYDADSIDIKKKFGKYDADGDDDTENETPLHNADL